MSDKRTVSCQRCAKQFDVLRTKPIIPAHTKDSMRRDAKPGESRFITITCPGSGDRR